MPRALRSSGVPPATGATARRGRPRAPQKGGSRAATRQADPNDQTIDPPQPNSGNNVNLPIAIANSQPGSSSVASTSAFSNEITESRLMIGSAGGSEASILNRGTSAGFRMASSIIPEYDGENMPVSMFIDHCRVASEAIEPYEMRYFVLLVRNKVTKKARQYVQGRTFTSLEEILTALERALSKRTDFSQSLQTLTNVTRRNSETIAEYGSRIFNILTEITDCLERESPGEAGKTMSEGMRKTAIRHFIRGLDMRTLSFLREKDPGSLEQAIDLATQADIEAKCWADIHQKSSEGFKASSASLAQDTSRSNPRKRVAHIKSSMENIQCFHCKETGHRRADCPARKNNSAGQKRERMYCEYCKRTNHLERNCYLKERHRREREAVASKRPRTSENLNSKRGRWEGATTTQTFEKRRDTGACSISEAEGTPASQKFD